MIRNVFAIAAVSILAACANPNDRYASDTIPGMIDCSKPGAMVNVPACRSIVRRAIP